MASPTHNRETARAFLDRLVDAYNRADNAQRQMMAETLLENLARADIETMEGPSYLLADFWEHLEKLAPPPPGGWY